MAEDEGSALKLQWHRSPVRDSDEVCEWRPLVEIPPTGFVIGIDSQDGFVCLVRTTGKVLPFSTETALFFVPILDMEYSSFADAVVENSFGQSVQLEKLTTQVLRQALAGRLASDISRALEWCESATPNEVVAAALQDLVTSKRGTQQLRQVARRVLKRWRAALGIHVP